MMHHYWIIVAGLTLGIFGATLSLAQQEQSIDVPKQQRDLSMILSKYNFLDNSAPNNIQRRKIDSNFRKDFCEKIPKGEVSGWIGEVDSIDDNSPGKGINLTLEVSVYDLESGGLGIELSLGNEYAYGIDENNTQPHESTSILPNSPLYSEVVNLRQGDTVKFSGTFIPFTSMNACYDSLSYTTYFSLFRFSSVQRIGWGFMLQ